MKTCNHYLCLMIRYILTLAFAFFIIRDVDSASDCLSREEHTHYVIEPDHDTGRHLVCSIYTVKYVITKNIFDK